MKDGFWMLLCAACLLLSARSVQARELTALDIFAQLPITLFENTPEGLSEDEKLRLIEQGQANFGRWSGSTPIASYWYRGLLRDAGGAACLPGRRQAACRTRDGRGRHVRP